VTHSLTFIVPGRPVPYVRTASNGRQRFTPKRLREYMDLVAYAAQMAAPEGGRWVPASGPVSLLLEVFPEDRVLADVSNILKSIEDGITKSGRVWLDDKQVADLRVRRMPIDKANPRAVVTVTAMQPSATPPQVGERSEECAE
jgi:Holliday junction resolvase RusA-like endonuclease